MTIDQDRSKPMVVDRKIASIDNDVKMVIWDLDDTFWNGTLAEGGVALIERHGLLVRTLAARGIISSIVSKNDYGSAQHVLEAEGLWDYFVFPSISFEPKGKRVSDIIEQASLRPQNVLYIDDNVINLQEARFFNAEIMLAYPGEILPEILEHPHLRGKPDPELKRLKQYKLLEQKYIDRKATDVSNEEFLRSSDIKIRFDFDMDRHVERVVELINRTNQLNYTKRRLENNNAVDEFRSSLTDWGVSAACISCSDRYGDYGVIGMYVLKRTDTDFKLLHFVFSCRTMNMGIEQFVYEYLGRPQIEIVPEVAYGLTNHGPIDWISIAENEKRLKSLITNNAKLLLVGGCELQQLSSFCSSNRVEYVNRTITYEGDDFIVRYDDPYFFVSDRDALRRAELLECLGGWTYSDAVSLDENIAQSAIIILAFRAALRHVFVSLHGGNVLLRMERRNIKVHLKRRREWFESNFSVVDVPLRERLRLIQNAFDMVKMRSRSDAIVFVLGTSTHKESSPSELTASGLYNKLCATYCRANSSKFLYTDVNEIVPAASVNHSDHYTRDGYYKLSCFIKENIDLHRI